MTQSKDIEGAFLATNSEDIYVLFCSLRGILHSNILLYLIYEGVSKSFRTGRLEGKLQMI